MFGPFWIVTSPLKFSVVFSIVFGNLAQLSSGGVPHFVLYRSGKLHFHRETSGRFQRLSAKSAANCRVIERHHSILAISAHHAQNHLWKVPRLITELSLRYRLFLRQHDVGSLSA